MLLHLMDNMGTQTIQLPRNTIQKRIHGSISLEFQNIEFNTVPLASIHFCTYLVVSMDLEIR